MNAEFRWTSSSLSNVGMVREVNEDASLDRPEAGIWVVADGMGGHKAGDVASGMIVDALRDVNPGRKLSGMVSDVEQCILNVNHELIKRVAGDEIGTIMGSTVVALVAMKHHCACMWAGDSRIYRYRQGGLRQLTRDHSRVEELIESGDLLPELAESHPQANIITRAVGVDEFLVLDVDVQELQDGDLFLLCSDGLYKEVQYSEIENHMVNGSCEEICENLVQLALDRGCRDNVTVVATRFEQS
jgi:protein phosphatase